MVGRVVSTKMNKTAVVLVERVAKHKLYKKTYLRSKRYLADDQVGTKEGDIVEIVKIKPVSKNKHWGIAKVVGQNLAEIVEAKQKEAAEAAIAEVMPEEPEDQSISVSAGQQVSKEAEIAETPKRRPADKPKKKETK